MNKDKKRKILGLAALAAGLIAFSSTIAYAWFSQSHKIARMQEVVPPNTIFLSAAHRKAEINFQIGEVNTSAAATHRDYVFSISGVGVPYYLLELAHTTNNPFTYTIYPATFDEYDDENPPAGTEGVDYVLFTAPKDNTAGAPATITNIDDISTETETVYYYKIDTTVDTDATWYTDEGAVAGSYLNKASDGPLLANSTGTYHDKTYNNITGNVDVVQKNAEPLYWKSSAILGDSRAFCHNYIIRVDWGGAVLDKKTKETDIIYLFASTTTAT